jgi:eukaryotic-like serine/threonine-protein kinase
MMALHGPPGARVSPDGRWIAYMSTVSGQTEIYIRALSGTGGQYPVSSGGGTEPMWNPRGDELFFRTGHRLVAATIAFAGEPRVVRRDTLPLEMPRSRLSTWATYDVARDGQRFLVVKAGGASNQPVIVVGWLDEVRALLNARPRQALQP